MRAAEGLMTSRLLLTMGFGMAAVAAGLAQAPAQTPPTGINLQAPNDPRYAEVIAKCKTPPPTRGGGGGAAGRAGGGPPPGGAAPGAGAGQARGAAAPAAPPDYTVTEIPGVIAAGQRWTSVYQTTGNNGDGPIAADDGALLIAQNDNGVVLKVDVKGQTSPVYRDTNTGGSLAMSSKGVLFLASRGINNAIWQLAPQRRIFANSYNGEPLECLGGVVNDLTADSRGGVYFTMGGLFHADAKGMVRSYGENLRTNGVILSPDEKTLYVTNGQSIAAFEVRPDGSLANQREFAKLPGGGGDGMTVDAAGRLYVTAGGGGGGGAAGSGVHVFAADGKHLGQIPSPRNLITAAFSGPDKKTLFAIANDRQRVDVYTIPMIAQGYKGRAK
jgi:gluconolactonase